MSQECGVDLAVRVFSAGKGIGWGLSGAPVCDSVSLTLSVCLSRRGLSSWEQDLLWGLHFPQSSCLRCCVSFTVAGTLLLVKH